MASYDWISASPDLELLGPTESREVMRVTVQAQPSGVVWAMNFRNDLFTVEGTSATLERLSQGFNAAAANPHVVAIQTTQRVTPSNQYIELALVRLSSTSGLTEKDYTAGYAVFEPNPSTGQAEVFESWAATRVAQLDRVEAGG